MITLALCRNDLEVQLCINALIRHDVKEASSVESPPSEHEVVSGQINRNDTRSIVVPDGIYSQPRVEQMQMLLEGVTWTLRTPFCKRTIDVFGEDPINVWRDQLVLPTGR